MVATIKLSTGDSFTIHNHCFDSFIKDEYCGDEIHVVDDLLVIGIFDYGEGMQYRSITLYYWMIKGTRKSKFIKSLNH